MGRPLRFVIPGYPQYIVQRGNNRTQIFLSELDYHYFHERLRFVSKKYSCDVHAYVLMPDHFHLLVTGHTNTSISKMMQILSRYYVQYFNRKYRRTGTLWDGRYKAALIESKTYLFTCSRFIELNPVRSGVVEKPEDYYWSSYRSNVAGVNDSLTKPHPLFQSLGESLQACRNIYHNMFSEKIGDDVVNYIRHSADKGWVIGSDAFKNELRVKLKRAVSPAKRGGDRRSLKYKQSRDKSLGCVDAVK